MPSALLDTPFLHLAHQSSPRPRFALPPTGDGLPCGGRARSPGLPPAPCAQSSRFPLLCSGSPDTRYGAGRLGLPALKDKLVSRQEMASDELRELRNAMTQEAIREHQMAKTGGTTTGLFQCKKCKKKNCTYNQVRRGGERKRQGHRDGEPERAQGRPRGVIVKTPGCREKVKSVHQCAPTASALFC